MRKSHVFLIALCFAMAAHAVYWRNLDDSPDQQSWIREMKQFHSTELRDQRESLYYGYPATTILLAGSFAQRLGVSSYASFAGIMTLGIAFPIAGSALLARTLRPAGMWWVGVAGLMTCSQLYYASTPPSAIVTPYITLILFFGLYIYERKRGDVATSLLLGALTGVAMATRLDIVVAIVGCLCVFLYPILKRNFFIVAMFALVVFSLLNPYMVAFPLQHIGDIGSKIMYHAERFSVSGSPLRPLILTIPLGIMGIVASAIMALSSRFSLRSIPRPFLVFLLGTNISIGLGLLFGSAYHPVWYFYPLLQIFEILFILYFLEGVERSAFARFDRILLGSVIAGSSFVFFTKLFL